MKPYKTQLKNKHPSKRGKKERTSIQQETTYKSTNPRMGAAKES
jgi:hypothetical protein